MAEFIKVVFETLASELNDVAIEKLEEEVEAKGVVGYEPNEGDLEIIQIGTISPMAANAATIASVLTEAVFRNFGTQLIKLPFNEGSFATATTKWKLLEEGGEFAAHTIEAGTTLEGGGLAFYVEKEVHVAKGESEVSVQVIGSERGTEYNGIKGILTLVNNLNYVQEVTIIGETSGGVEQETDEEYLNRLVAALKLQAPRPITANNFAEFALQAPSTLTPTGFEIGRATSIDGYNPEEFEFEGTPKKAGKELTEVTSYAHITAESTSLPQKHPGTRIKGTGIVEGSTVVTVNEGGKKAVLSIEPSAEPGKEKLKAIGTYLNERTVTVFIKMKGTVTVTEEQKTKLKTYLEEHVEINFKVFVEPASYNKIYVTTKVHVLPNFAEASVVEAVKAAVVSYLSPETWANQEIGGEGGLNSWLNATQGFNIIRVNTLIGVIERVPGVAYVPVGGLKVGTAPTPTESVDVTMLGPAPLPECETSFVLVEGV